MGYERYPRNSNLGDYYGSSDDQDFGRDYGSGRDYSYSGARDYRAAGQLGRDRDDDNRWRDDDRARREARDYGPREYGYGRYAQRDQFGAGQSGRGYGNRGGADYRGSYADDGRRFAETGRDRDYGRQPQGYDYRERGFFDRAGDEVRSWFGDEEAERRRHFDARHDAQSRDDDYHSWRRDQVSALDRDYDEYRRENRSRFASEFATWRTDRQGQRSSLDKVKEHQDVVGSDGEHVGTVDKVRGDRIILTKSDADAGGRHHSIPSRWIQNVDDKVTLRKTAEEAHAHWRDEERNQALFNDGDDRSGDQQQFRTDRNLNRSFSGTY